jgi:hypothetical protein
MQINALPAMSTHPASSLIAMTFSASSGIHLKYRMIDKALAFGGFLAINKAIKYSSSSEWTRRPVEVHGA